MNLHLAENKWSFLGLGWMSKKHNNYMYCSNGKEECPLRFRGGAHPVAALLAKGLPGKWGSCLLEHVESKKRKSYSEIIILTQ